MFKLSFKLQLHCVKPQFIFLFFVLIWNILGLHTITFCNFLSGIRFKIFATSQFENCRSHNVVEADTSCHHYHFRLTILNYHLNAVHFPKNSFITFLVLCNFLSHPVSCAYLNSVIQLKETPFYFFQALPQMKNSFEVIYSKLQVRPTGG